MEVREFGVSCIFLFVLVDIFMADILSTLRGRLRPGAATSISSLLSTCPYFILVILLCQGFNEENFNFLNSTNLFRNTYSRNRGQKRRKSRLLQCLGESGKGVRFGYVFRAGSGRMSGLFASNLNITRKFNYKGSHSPGFDESTAQKTGKNEPKENKKRKNTYNNEYEVFT